MYLKQDPPFVPPEPAPRPPSNPVQEAVAERAHHHGADVQGRRAHRREPRLLIVLICGGRRQRIILAPEGEDLLLARPRHGEHLRPADRQVLVMQQVLAEIVQGGRPVLAPVLPRLS